MTNSTLRNLLSTVTSIALVGASPKAHRPSYEVMQFLQVKGFKVYPINPVHSGKIILGEHVYSSLKEIPTQVDMVDIFRNSEAAGEVCYDILALPKKQQPTVIWMQIGVINQQAAELMESNHFIVVMNECPKRILN